MIRPVTATPRNERKKKGLANRRKSHASITKTACALATAGERNGPCQSKRGAMKTPMMKLVTSIASTTMKTHLQYRDECESVMVERFNSNDAFNG